MEFYTAFLIGLVGSLHCIGMCGPVTLMLPSGAVTKVKFIFSRFLYNIGRIFTYMFMGIVIGFIGNKIFLYGYQQSLSIVLGIIILIVVLFPGISNKAATFILYNKFLSILKKTIGRLFSKGTSGSFFSIGLLNGFLPCGLVYAALGTAAATGSALSGMGVMLFFGLGTLPVMFAVSSFAKFLSLNMRNKAAKFVPVFAVILAIIFILRGLNLGIPFISPKLNKAAVISIECIH